MTEFSKLLEKEDKHFIADEYYLGSFQISKGIMLFKFRFWVTRGMLSYFNTKFNFITKNNHLY